MSTSNKKEWFRDLDISSQGKPTGIDQIDGMVITDTCYCITSNNDIIKQVDVYKDGQKIHYKKFDYDNLGRVVKNAMYSPNKKGGWHIIDDVWYYEYDSETGLRTKKVMRMPGASTAQEILYDENGNRTSEKTITIND